MEDFGWAGDEFLMGDCQDDWNGWETDQCFQEQWAEEAHERGRAQEVGRLSVDEAWEDAYAELNSEMAEDSLLNDFITGWRDPFDDARDAREW